MQSTRLQQCQPKPIDDKDNCVFDLLPEAPQHIITPDFKSTQQSQQQQNKSSVMQSIISTTDKYGFNTKNEQKKLDIKTLNARIEKWREMLKNYNNVDKNILKERVRKGVPDGMRLLAWPILAGVPEGKAEACLKCNCAQYSDFLKEGFFKFEHQIRLDVFRTFPDNVNFQDQTTVSESLVTVLKALSVAIPQMGYCQGLNFLTAALIMVTNDENAFWILYRLMTKYKQTPKYQDPNKLYREFSMLDSLVAQYLPKTSQILKKFSIDFFYFTTEWFITLFSATLPIDLFYRIFEIFLLEGEKTLFRCALTILSFKEPKLIQLNDFEKGLRYLKEIDDLQLIDPDQFISTMLNKFKFSKQLLIQLETKYQKQAKK